MSQLLGVFSNITAPLPQVFDTDRSYHPSANGLNALLGHHYSASINAPGTERIHRADKLLKESPIDVKIHI